MHIILTGATGLVGSAVLDALLGMPEVARISVLSRRPVPLLEERVQKGDAAARTDRVQVLLHTDFLAYDAATLQTLAGATGVVWALGVSQTQVDAETYVQITHDYPLAFARAWTSSSPGPPLRFVYVSGEGATTEPGVFTARFGPVKGAAEADLAKLAASAPDRLDAVSVRPGAVDPAGHAAILPYVPTSWTTRLLRTAVLPALRCVYAAGVCPTQPLGRFLAEVATGRFDDRAALKNVRGVTWLGAAGAWPYPVINNAAFRRLAKLD